MDPFNEQAPVPRVFNEQAPVPRVVTDGQTLSVHSIFSTIQG